MDLPDACIDLDYEAGDAPDAPGLAARLPEALDDYEQLSAEDAAGIGL